jgi:hypothetical protein
MRFCHLGEWALSGQVGFLLVIDHTIQYHRTFIRRMTTAFTAETERRSRFLTFCVMAEFSG